MTSNGHLRLQHALGLANLCLYVVPEVQALRADAGQDPLRLNLPPLLQNGVGVSGTTPGAAVLRVMATLYLQAELEQAGIIPVVELLAQERTNLTLVSPQLIALLEDFAQQSQHWYDRHTRDLLFARLFGIGRAATNEEGSMVNRDFQQRFANLCVSIERYGEDYALGHQALPEQMREADLRQATTDLLFNLGSRQFGNTLLAARVIDAQLLSAINLLKNPELESLFAGQGLWDTLRKIIGPDAPDLGRIVDRGQNGIHLLDWLADVIPQLNRVARYRPLLPAQSPVFGWAATWLRATGIEMTGGASPASPLQGVV